MNEILLEPVRHWGSAACRYLEARVHIPETDSFDMLVLNIELLYLFQNNKNKGPAAVQSASGRKRPESRTNIK